MLHKICSIIIIEELIEPILKLVWEEDPFPFILTRLCNNRLQFYSEREAFQRQSIQGQVEKPHHARKTNTIYIIQEKR
jgi:hypothetical protein